MIILMTMRNYWPRLLFTGSAPTVGRSLTSIPVVCDT